MAFDTPARIAIVGAGPIGLETALYARFLGYDVDVYEQGSVCEHVRHWQDVQLFTPFGMNCSTLGLAAISAQDPSYRLPQEEQVITGRQWLDQYLLPLSQTDLIADQIHNETKVVAISRRNLLKSERGTSEDQDENGFRILVQTNGKDENREADIVIDVSGVLSQPNWIGGDGAPAVGEIATRRKNDELPAERKFWQTDILVGSEQAARFANKSILVLGSGYSAASTISELANLAKTHSGTKVTWITRHGSSNSQPIQPIKNDSLARRAQLAETVNQLVVSDCGWLRHLGGTFVESVQYDELQGKCLVRVLGEANEEIACDQIVANVGYRPDLNIFRELQVQLCHAIEGLMGLSAKLAGDVSPESLVTQDAESLVTTEQNFYLLGAKSYGRNSSFSYANGLAQIRSLFSLIVDRAGLDLYATTRNLLPNS